MKRFFAPLILISLILSACTSEQGQIKDKALVTGQERFEAMLVKEADGALNQSALLHQSYIEFMKGSSEVDVADLKMLGENQATVTLTMKTYSTLLRQTALEIAQKVEPSKTRRFNFGEAISLIAQQKGINKPLEEQPLAVLKFQKSKGQWLLQN
ncbi:MAG: hypothetical protein ACXVCP_19710 [Bdellovibrio sp.]